MTDTKASIRRTFIKEYEARHLRVPLLLCGVLLYTKQVGF